MNKTQVLTVLEALTPQKMADEIVLLWDNFKQARTEWEREVIEIREYVTATSTQTTEVADQDFSNTTTIPKIAHIATNLRANYAAHIFSTNDWIHFEAFDKDSAAMQKKRVVEAYARTKARRKDYEGVLSACLDDYVMSGVTFGKQRYIREYGRDSEGNQTIVYEGGELERIAPQNIVFDITAASFQKARKVVRTVYSIGDIARIVQEGNTLGFTQELLDDISRTHMMVRTSGITKPPRGIDWQGIGLRKDGFGDLLNYMKGDMIEVHEFYGDMYSMETGEFLPDHHIVVVDRRHVISKEPNTTDNGTQYLYYATPEKRPDNLMGMSPLARLIGMQFKLDKLENMRADIFDMIAYPTTVEKGEVDFYGTRGEPGGRYVVDEQGDVKYLLPDTTVLNADFQINQTMAIMEELAGSPRNASGQRTPGEKTKFEVQILDNGGNRIFRDRTVNFERNFIEPILNDLVQLGRDNLGATDLVSTTSNEFNVEEFLSISKDDLAVSGKIRARGSSIFAEKANALQNIVQIFSQPIVQQFAQHISSIKLAEALEELGDFKKFGIITKNIAVQEQAETQALAEQSQRNKQTVDTVGALGDTTSEPETVAAEEESLSSNQQVT